MIPSRPAHRPEAQFDVILVGGGLQNGLIALALAESRPELSVALIERGRSIGGEHTWCFHAEDVSPAALGFVGPLIEHRWSGYDVVFPGAARSLDSAYCGLSSEHFRSVVEARFAAADNWQLLLGAEVTQVESDGVRLADGRSLTARTVVDSRGPEVDAARGRGGFQKFVGHELELANPHGLERPIVMDATVAQRGGFRFFYMLPFAPRRVLVEDTYFSDTADLDSVGIGTLIEAQALARGWQIERVVRREHGVLPMPWAGAPAGSPSGGPILGGYRGGWLHPATGYSFPIAVRVAERFVTHSLDEVEMGLADLARELTPQLRFARFLNRLLFRWYLPENRAHVFERFYRMPEDVIRRFYSLRTTARDRLRFFVGRPPRGFSVRARLTAAERFADAPCL